MSTHGVLFPGEYVYLDVFVANAIRLMAEIGNEGLKETEHTHWPQSKLLKRAFAIAPSTLSPYGAIAIFPPEHQRGVILMPNCVRFEVKVVGRYERLSEADFHASYPCILARFICETPIPRLSEPVHHAFPYLSPHPSKRLNKRNSPVLTRSATRHLLNRGRLRSSAEMGGLSFSHWMANQPETLLKKAKFAAMYARLRFDKLMIEHAPDENDCPAAWSFWLAAGLAEDTSNEALYPLLAETSVIARLRYLLRLLEERIRVPPIKRRRTSADRAFVVRSPKRMKGSMNLIPSLPRPSPVSRSRKSQPDSLQEAVELPQLNPWPCSSANGFKKVSRWACRGYFRPFLNYETTTDNSVSGEARE